MSGWGGLGGEVAMAVEQQTRTALETYRNEPRRVGQDANIERSIAEGAYAGRQTYELVQNAADAARSHSSPGRVEILLTSHTLYVANTGQPLSVDGVIALLGTHDSVKRDDKIGRFGLGFKSLLAVSDSPRVLSRSGSFAFDREFSADQLRRIVPGQAHYPVMRLARAIDPSDAAAADPLLRDLMSWADTVVVAPVKAHRSVLAKSLDEFPAEFLLFSGHMGRVDLEDRDDGEAVTARRITASADASGAVVLDDAGRKSTWVVRSQWHSPGKKALEDGGYSAARERVEVAWAAPLEGAPKGIGRFWAYFPTQSLTTLSGIVNAPWKLADDRESLLPGDFNKELLTQVLPKLVAAALPAIHGAGERPTAVLDVLPARGKEARNVADDLLNGPVIKEVSERPCIPTLARGLRHPTRVRLHPDGLREEELELWRSVCLDPDWWVTHSVVSAEHRSKVQRLLAAHHKDAVSLKQWVEHLLIDPTPQASAVAVRLIASLVARLPSGTSQVEELKRARVLLLDDGTVDACRQGHVFLPGPTSSPGRLVIDPILASDPFAVSALKRIGIQIFDEAGALRSELGTKDVDWTRVWAAARKMTSDEAEGVFRDVLGDRLLETLRVRTWSGKWKTPGSVLLPGDLIPGDGSRDVDHVVDSRFHQQDLELLERLGLVTAPRRLAAPPMEAWREARLDAVREKYRRMVDTRIRDSAIDIDEGRVFWPLELLPRLSPESAAAMTSAVVRQLIGDEKWKINKRGGGAGQKSVDDMTWFHLRDHGRLSTQIGVQPVASCLRWDEEVAAIDGVEQPLPYVGSWLSDEQADALNLKHDPSELKSADWQRLLEASRAWPDDKRFLLYAWAAYVEQPPPPRLRVRRGPGFVEVPADRAAVTCRQDVFDSLVAAQVPCLHAASEADFQALNQNWKMPDGSDMLTESVDYELAGEAFVLVDRYPPLALSLDPSLMGVTIQPCKRLEVLTSTPGGQQTRPLQQYMDKGVVFVTGTDDRTMLLQVARGLDLTFKPDVVLERMDEQRRNKLRQEVVRAPDVLDKLLLAIGVDELRAAVPSAALQGLARTTEQEALSDRDIAQLALAVDGYATLSNHTAALKRNGLNPPSVWAGRRTAREWVRELGFPIEFAGFSGMQREAEMEVEGPPVLGDLHEYQRAIADKVKRLVDPATEVARGLLCLPTGAGKTRVAVEALVECLSASDSDMRILWLAENDELCEQATQTWSQVWRAKGRPGTPMTLSRLWASNEPTERDGHQVVVASLAKLDAVIKRNDGDWEEGYGWLAGPSIIVVDEAHRSTGQQYTRTLSALSGTKRVAEMTTPLLGLTATPFRGYNAKETEQLAGRYHRNLLDAGVFPGDDVYGYLQDHGVLARIRYKELKGAELELTEAELTFAEKMKSLPETVENRLGKNEDRNLEIIRSVLELPEDQTSLLFATSVENAKVLAALLTYNGVEARAVAGTTDANARRRYVEDFKSKRIRVLTNYNVFTEGFDVPKVDAVYITRPTFSPNVYQQMIGRGLRGPLNGGKEEVLIVNVADNLTNFGAEFAFRHFEYLWGRGQEG